MGAHVVTYVIGITNQVHTSIFSFECEITKSRVERWCVSVRKLPMVFAVSSRSVTLQAQFIVIYKKKKKTP
jgi:hypothetical protein